ncbi:hypothetical protein VE03_06096 [Pseudogymnoascus sp. 23342-1-I1]|nr:hypothetical protein VE03_06096 [Pseudogymnoascus sp. 23342-1-I1]
MLPHLSINLLPQEIHVTSQDAQFSLPPVPGILQMPIPGVKCPTCLANGIEVWVIRGKVCGNCGTECG